MIAATVEELTLDEVRDIYNHRMIHDFPRNERKSLGIIEAAIRKGNYSCYGYKDGDSILAYAFYVKLDHNYLLDYFAVDEVRRGTGIGGQFLQELCQTVLQDADVAVLEAEDPTEAKSDSDREKRERRVRFYEHNGMVDTGVRSNVFWTDYVILRMPVGETEADVREAYMSFYRSILSPLLFKTMIHLKPEK